MRNAEKQSFRLWWDRLVAINPFYIGSAVLILYGIVLVNNDERFLDDDLSQILFNLSAVELYELCLIAFAVVLMRRKIFRDSLLLVFLESLFLTVPLILLNGSIHVGLDWSSAIAAVAVVGYLCRAFGLSSGMEGLRLNRNFWTLTLAPFLVNLALPFVFWYGVDRGDLAAEDRLLQLQGLLNWIGYLVLPVAFAAPIFLRPRNDRWGAGPGRPWLPVAFLGMLCGMSLFHVRWVAYTYDIRFGLAVAMPALWMLSWVLSFHRKRLTRHRAALVLSLYHVLPVFVSFFVLRNATTDVARWLALLNLLLFSALAITGLMRRVSIACAAVSGISLLLTFRSQVATTVTDAASYTRQSPLALYVLLIAIILLSLRFRTSATGLAGAGAVAVLATRLLGGDFLEHELGITLGFLFFLLHAPFWAGKNWLDETLVVGGGVLWVIYALGLATGSADWTLVLVQAGCALVPLGCYGLMWAFERRRRELATAVACGFVAISPAVKGVASLFRQGAVGPLIIGAAFFVLLIGFGVSMKRKPQEDPA